MVATAAQSIGPVQRLLLLRRLQALSQLPPHSLTMLAEHARERVFARGQHLLRDGEPVSALHFVVDGLVHVEHRGLLLGHVGPEASGPVGGVAVFARAEDGLFAVAEQDTMTLELDTETLLEILEDSFPILLTMLRDVCRQIVEQQRRHPDRHRVEAAANPVVRRSQDLDLVERIFLLRQTSPFRQSSINALAELSRTLTEVSFPQGACLWREGDASGEILLLVSGTVCATLSGGGRFGFGSGAALGAVESTAETPRFFSAVASTPLVALRGHDEHLVDVLEDNTDMAMDYLAAMCRWLLDAHARLGPEAAEIDQLFGCESVGCGPG